MKDGIEIWKVIPDTNGMYEASTLGYIRSVDRVVEHRTSGFLTLKGKLLKMNVGNNDYYYVTICQNAKRVKHNVHVLIAKTFIGPRPYGYHIDHDDRNRKNNKLSNLSYKTVLDNCSFKGSKSALALLTEAQVVEIKRKYKHRIYTAKMLANEYNVEPSTINKITSGINWKHVNI